VSESWREWRAARWETRAHLVRQHDPSDSLGVPEELVDVVVPDDILVIPLPLEELALDDLVSLISDESVERLDDCSKVETFGDGFDPVLALWRPVVVVGALEDEAEAFRNETNLSCFSPAEKEERDLSKSVVLAHVVHGLSPPVDG